MPITTTRTRRELHEAIRWKGKDRAAVLIVRDGIVTARPKGAPSAPELLISVAGAYEAALARSVGFDPRPPKRRK